ncbi:MAG TPA: MOSC domain-containing protein, partial [Cellvibrionaceae bacterium]|nr:MOSC domain-containing protein [Cellvibrionaceae bacterium]
ANLGFNRLLMNNGDGTFEDTTSRSGAAGSNVWTTSCAIVDVNHDGLADIYAVNYLGEEAVKTICRDPETGKKLHSCIPKQFPSEDDQLFLTAPGLPPIALTGLEVDAPCEPSQVWKTPVQVQALAALTDWFALVVPGASLRLVQLAAPRPMLTERFGSSSETHFADAAPYLVANTASLAALNQALISEGETPVDERRFRANIWLDGITAFTEHQVPVLSLPQGQIRMVDHCQRCSVITVDPERGVFCPNAKPFKTLARLNAMPNQPKAPAFGVNAVFEQTENTWVAVGEWC